MAQARSGAKREALQNFAEAIPVLLSRSRASDDETDSVSGGARLQSLILDGPQAGASPHSGQPARAPQRAPLRPVPPAQAGGFKKDALKCLTLEGAIARKSQIGGTARKQVEIQLKSWEKELQAKGSKR